MKKIFIFTVSVFGALGVQAENAAFQASLTPDIAIQSKTTEIDGLSLNIWGQNPQKSFTLGFINGSTGDSAGFSVGLANYDESYTGIQWGFVNYSSKKFVGWQNAAINVSQGYFKGLQHGYVNVSEEFHGLQLGWVNYADNLKNGVQIGLVNIAVNNPWFTDFPDKLAKGFPIVNWSF